MAGQYGNAAIAYLAAFNGVQFSTIPGLQVYAIDDYMPDRSLAIFPIARTDAQKLVSAFYQKRVIYISLYIATASRAKADQAIDALNALIQGTEGTLLIEKSGTQRQYTATFEKVAKNTSGVGRSNVAPPQGGLVDLTLVFECSDSFGYDQFFTPMVTQSGITSSPNTWNWTFGGSAAQQVPVLQFYFTGGSLGAGTVTVGNNNSGQAVSVTRTWAVGDTLIINTQLNTVQVNGVDVAFTGALPTFGTGLQTITYQDTFTSRTYSPYFYVFQRWN